MKIIVVGWVLKWKVRVRKERDDEVERSEKKKLIQISEMLIEESEQNKFKDLEFEEFRRTSCETEDKLKYSLERETRQ